MSAIAHERGPAATASPDGYPRTIDNGAGERLTFLRRVPDPAGDRLEVENLVAPGSGPPMHVHHHQEEALTVQEGRIAYQRPGEPPRFAGVGATVSFAPGEPHRFWNPGQDDLRVSGYLRPADNAEFLLTALYRSQRERGGGRPGMLDVAFLSTRYRSEMGILDGPAAVRRLALPLLAVAGRLLGRYRRYADAPEPIRR
ncbi:MAG: cupin domain-containing protein [Solirubrobacteraceae bacterium]